MREEYISPVGFAKEPGEERKRWIGRFFLFLLVALIVYLLVFRVLNPVQDNPRLPQPAQSTLPAPV